MADSENSRTLPSNGYRNLLSATERLLSELAAEKSDAIDADAGEVLTKWTAWSRAYSECLRLCSVQQHLESELFRVATKQPQGDQYVSDDLPSNSALELAVSDRLSEESYKGLAHRRAKAAEDSASAREQLLAEQLWSASGKSAISAMAKMHCVLEQGEPVANSAEFPWPQIRSALTDLLMASTLEITSVRDRQGSCPSNTPA